MFDVSDIYTLMEIIRRKEAKDLLTREQTKLINTLYDRYISDELKNMGYDLDVDSIETILQSPKLSNLQRMYLERTIYDDAIILEDLLDQIKDLSKEQKEEIHLFKTLLKYKNKTVMLSTLYEETYKGILDKKTIKTNKANPEILKEFFIKLNGCILEETVGDVDLSNFNPNDFSTIGINMGTNIDPLLMVKALTPAPLLNLANESNQEVTFLNIADLHLDRDCFDERGNLLYDKLEANLTSFIAFKEGLVKKLKEEGIQIAGIVYSGDIFEAFTKVNAKWDVKRKDIHKLIGSVINFERRARSGEIIEGESISLGLGQEDAGFVAYLAGNHDMTLGRVTFNKIMKLFGSSVAKPDIISLSNGGVRIGIGDDLISLMHHASLDWGFGDELEFTTRFTRDKVTFRFQEYLKICQAYYDSLPGNDLLKQQKDNNLAVYDLLTRVNQKIKDENPELYNFYLPYIIVNNATSSTAYRIEHRSKTIIRPTTSFFRNFIVLKDGKLETLIDDRGKILEPSIMTYKGFIINDGYYTRLETAYNTIKERLPEEKRRKPVIPQFGRGDAYQPVITMLSHFHTGLAGSPNRRERRSYGPSRGKGKTRNRLINVAIEEGGNKVNEEEYSVTQYRFDVENNHVKIIYVKPLESLATLIKAVPKCELYAVFEDKYETQFNAPKEKKTK